jgi:peptidoglycan LD-endopeptidase LytH
MITRVLLTVLLFVSGFLSGFYFGHKSNESVLRGTQPEAGSRPSPFEPKKEETRSREAASRVPSEVKEEASERRAAAAPDEAVAPSTRTASMIRLPIDGLKRDQILDTFDDARGEQRRHEASDIMAPRGTPVKAVVRGRVQKLFDSKPGGLTVYQFDEREQYCYYYAHLDAYAAGLREGQMLEAGQVLGTVGTTGNADPNAPHLHFAIFQLGPEKQWWKGTPLNPYPLLVAAFESRRNR